MTNVDKGHGSKKCLKGKGIANKGSVLKLTPS
jgi:hypothetical protein